MVRPPAPEEVLTPERLDTDTRLMAESAADFLRGEVLPAADRIEAKEPGLMESLLLKAGELGLLGTDIPEQYGGLGLAKSASARIAEALAAEPAFAVSHSVHSTVAALPLVFFGTAEQKARYLPCLASGEIIGAYALSESQSASDALNMRTRAVPQPDGSFLLSGEKMWITNAAFGGLFTVFAKVDDAVTAFLVERDTPGLAISREEHKLGLKGSSTCRLLLDDVRVPAENLLGAAGDGGRIALNVLNVGRFKIAASAVGQSKNLLGIATRYAKQRHAFGKPIAEFGLIQQKLATMAARTFAAESMLYRVAGLLDTAFAGIDPEAADATERYRQAAQEYAIECALIKVYCTEALDYVADECLQIHGGYGYTEEYPAARAWRDARVTRIYEGTNEINRLNIVSLLQKRLESGRPTLADTDSAKAGRLISTIRAPLQDEWRSAVSSFTSLTDSQQICAGLADLVIVLFAEESVAIRGENREPAASLILDRIRAEVDSSLLNRVRYLASGDALANDRFIAEAVLDRDGYPWA